MHGGAILIRHAAPEEPILARSQDMGSEKEKIGRATATLVNDGETIFLGSGTTVLEVARNLAERNLTVITNSLPVINIMAEKHQYHVDRFGWNFACQRIVLYWSYYRTVLS